jgi:hypothetical protein
MALAAPLITVSSRVRFPLGPLWNVYEDRIDTRRIENDKNQPSRYC